MTSDPYSQLAHHLHTLCIGYPLRDELVDILRASSSPAEVDVALALPCTRIPLKLASVAEVATEMG